jgi:hypothetical protein
MRSFRPLAALVALVLAVALAAPLPAARCRTASGGGCPLMKGAAGSLCHRSGAIAAPMDCCRTKSAPAPAPAADGQLQPAPVALLPVAADLAARCAAPRPAVAVAARERAAGAIHALGLFTLLSVFRN